MEKKKKIWITEMAVVIGVAGYGVYKIQDNRKREAAYQSAKDSLVLKLEENPAIECGTEIDDMNALALSYVKESHGDLSVKGTDSIDPKKVGEGELTYTVSAKDAYGVDVSKTQTLEVKVVDTVAPEITLVKDTVELTVGDEFDPLTNIKSVKDKADGEMDKATVEVDNPVDMTKPGEYAVTITAKDISGNKQSIAYPVAVVSKQAIATANKSGTTRRTTAGRNTNVGTAGNTAESAGSGSNSGDMWDIDSGVLFDKSTEEKIINYGKEKWGENSSWIVGVDTNGNIIAEDGTSFGN